MLAQQIEDAVINAAWTVAAIYCLIRIAGGLTRLLGQMADTRRLDNERKRSTQAERIKADNAERQRLRTENEAVAAASAELIAAAKASAPQYIGSLRFMATYEAFIRRLQDLWIRERRQVFFKPEFSSFLSALKGYDLLPQQLDFDSMRIGDRRRGRRDE